MHQPCCLCERPRVTLLDALANSEGAGAALAGRRGLGGNRCGDGSRGEQPRTSPKVALTERGLAGYRHARRRTYSIPCTRGRTCAVADPTHCRLSLVIIGTPERTRTSGLLLRRQALYPLSYGRRFRLNNCTAVDEQRC